MLYVIHLQVIHNLQDLHEQLKIHWNYKSKPQRG